MEYFFFCNYKGRLYDAQGNYHNDSWWSQESIANFKERANCFVNEYSKFSEAAVNVSKQLFLYQPFIN